MEEYEAFELSNGIRVVHKQVSGSKIAHCAIMLDIGSRDEKEHQQGLAHFWEHMAFKGTKKRKAFHVINRLESLGGELNAYTTKEKICFYSTVLDHHLDKSVELLYDITFNSTFPEDQMDMERQVILEEMSMYKDSPEDAIQDDLDFLIFQEHQLGKNILGEEKSVAAFKRRSIEEFIRENLDTSRIVISSVGSYPLKNLKKIVEKYFKDQPQVSMSRPRLSPNGFTPVSKIEERDILQSHVGMGRRAFDIHSNLKAPFFVLNNILGGHSLNSRLNLSLREKSGLVYNIESNYQAMTDTGVFSIFYATDPKNVNKSIHLIEREFDKLRTKPLGDKQLQSAKDQIKGQLAMAEENNQNFMLMMAKSLLDHGRIESIEQVFRKIDEVSKDTILELANDMLRVEDMSVLKFVR